MIKDVQNARSKIPNRNGSVQLTAAAGNIAREHRLTHLKIRLLDHGKDGNNNE